MSENIDYTDMVIADMYEILTIHKNPWPSNFTKRKKLEFLDKIIAYLTDTEQFEKCKVLIRMKEKIANESISKNKPNRQ